MAAIGDGNGLRIEILGNQDEGLAGGEQEIVGRIKASWFNMNQYTRGKAQIRKPCRL